MAAPYIDVVAMDLKLPSSLGRECWDEQTECLQLASARNVFVKIVVDENTGGEEIARAVSLIAGVEKSIPLVLQPESGILFSGMQARQRLLSRVIEYQGRAMKILRDVRIIPQCHRILNMR
jgi:7-carboxy-7-deazaguanine synthase